MSFFMTKEKIINSIKCVEYDKSKIKIYSAKFCIVILPFILACTM